jgi:hypothetical protein
VEVGEVGALRFNASPNLAQVGASWCKSLNLILGTSVQLGYSWRRQEFKTLAPEISAAGKRSRKLGSSPKGEVLVHS